MGARGPQPKGSQGLTIVSGGSIEAVHRPDPPNDLTDEMAEEWRQVVNRMPADWFPAETWGLLTQYCTHITRARRLRSLINEMEASAAFNPADYNALLLAETKQSNAISSLAYRMRLAQSSIHGPDKKKGPSAVRKVEDLWA